MSYSIPSKNLANHPKPGILCLRCVTLNLVYCLQTFHVCDKQMSHESRERYPFYADHHCPEFATKTGDFETCRRNTLILLYKLYTSPPLSNPPPVPVPVVELQVQLFSTLKIHSIPPTCWPSHFSSPLEYT